MTVKWLGFKNRGFIIVSQDYEPEAWDCLGLGLLPCDTANLSYDFRSPGSKTLTSLYSWVHEQQPPDAQLCWTKGINKHMATP